MRLNFKKMDGLIPAIIQDAHSGSVLMLAYMNREAYEKSVREGIVSFFSRSRNRLWTKGETSGNHLIIEEIIPDCDRDTILIKARPTGPVCHTGADTCFDERNEPDGSFLRVLESIIHSRREKPVAGSYTAGLFREGRHKIAQKVGEEAVEVVIDSISKRKSRTREEIADLIYHLLVLMADMDISLNDIENILRKRHQ